MISVTVALHLWYNGEIVREAVISQNFLDLASAIFWAVESREKMEIGQVSQHRGKIDAIAISTIFKPALKFRELHDSLKDVVELRSEIVQILPEDPSDN